jgi:hypothetical protein
MPSMPKVRASSGTIGTMFLPMFLSAAACEHAHEGHRRRDLAVPLPFEQRVEASSAGTASGAAFARRCGR